MSASQHDGHGPKMRVEDARLVTGGGKFTADWNEPGQLYGQFLRSDRAHAEIVSVKADTALRLAGVKAVLTGADAVRAGYVKAPHSLNFPGINGMQTRAPERPVLAHGKVRFVGEALALVVADSAETAADAAELVKVEYRTCPPWCPPRARWKRARRSSTTASCRATLRSKPRRATPLRSRRRSPGPRISRGGSSR